MTLRLDHISKRFGYLVALNDVSLVVAPGEVHALLGENGAGKTTLMHIAYGLVRPDAGTIAVDSGGQPPVTVPGFMSPRTARLAGIGMVHQHFTSIPALTVAENIALTAGWPESGAAADRRAARVIERLGLALRVSDAVESLSVQMRQRLEIVKALAADARILLLDEPTAVLAPREVDELLQFIATFARGGGSVLLITHKLDEVFRAAARVTVLRRGEVVLHDATTHQTPPSLSRAMIGSDMTPSLPRRAQPGETLVDARDLAVRRRGSGHQGAGVTGATFVIHAGEIVGVAAIDGNGQRELLRAIAGVDDIAVEAGTLDVTGPVAFIPDDRTTEGLIPSFTLTENLLLGPVPRTPFWLDWGAIRRRTGELLTTHDVRAPDPGVRADTLSGGNQQKFILARALAARPRVIVAEDPARGLDVQATRAVHERLREAALGGAGVVVHASDLDEVLGLADRLLVVAQGRVCELAADTPRADVGDAMLAVPAVA